jgi:hypothetical protein
VTSLIEKLNNSIGARREAVIVLFTLDAMNHHI